MQQKPEANNKYKFLPIKLCFVNVYTYPKSKPTPYNNAKTVIIVFCQHNVCIQLDRFFSGLDILSRLYDIMKTVINVAVSVLAGGKWILSR